MKIWYVERQLIGFDGTVMTQPVKFCATEGLAKELVVELQKQTQSLMQATITVMTPQGARAVMDVAHFLAELGVRGMNFPVICDDVHESNLVLARPVVQLQ